MSDWTSGWDVSRASLRGACGSTPFRSARCSPPVPYYNELGYIPYDVHIDENVARTLEYAYDDWCIYRMGKELGRPESEITIFKQRCRNYRNVFDPAHKLMRGKNKDGQFQSPFSPFKWGDAFTEGNSWHYSREIGRASCRERV